MRAALALFIVGLALAACGGSEEKTVVVPQQAPATIVVPQGASVVCPGGAPAVYANGAYRC
jgi:hypothetical protein